MPSDFAFRLSTYLTLALSCVCLGYSEWDLLPESGVLAGVVLVLLAVSFRSGTRYELDLQSANRVGLVIGLLAAGWLAYQFVNKNSLIYTLPWPASLLPYLGPLLMVLDAGEVVPTEARRGLVGDAGDRPGRGRAGQLDGRGRGVRGLARALRGGRGDEPDPVLLSPRGRGAATEYRTPTPVQPRRWRPPGRVVPDGWSAGPWAGWRWPWGSVSRCSS